MCEALLVASFPQSSNVNFFENPNKNPAANKSPAPVVSRTSNPSIGGINIELFALNIFAPFAPLVTTAISTIELIFSFVCPFKRASTVSYTHLTLPTR